MSTNYKRVVPRDLFRESLLLKCLGRLCLLIHDGKINWLTFMHDTYLWTDNMSEAFEIGCRDSDGGLYCNSIRFYRPKTETEPERCIDVYTGLARKGEHWPLLHTTEEGEEIEVFDNEGNITREFQKAVTGEFPPDICPACGQECEVDGVDKSECCGARMWRPQDYQ